MNFDKFLFEEGILGISIGTILAFGITNVIKSFKNDIITPYIIKKYKINKHFGNFTGSILELFIIIALLTLVYYVMVVPIFKKHMDKKKEVNKKEQIWKSKLLTDVDKIERKIIGTF